MENQNTVVFGKSKSPFDTWKIRQRQKKVLLHFEMYAMAYR